MFLPVSEALEQVRRLQDLIVQKRQFRGYSGRARIWSGLAALAGTTIMTSTACPATPEAQLLGWGLILVTSLLFNYAALGYWFLFDPDVRRNPIMLKPALDALPALAIGGVLSLALILRSQYDLLFGTWLSLYGLAQVTYRLSLPPGIYLVGLAYVALGTLAWFLPHFSFLNPWPVGVCFFLGELAGGCILIHAESSDSRSSSGPSTHPEREGDHTNEPDRQ